MREATKIETENLFAPHVALFFVQVFFGSGAILGKLALAAFPPAAIVGFRVGCAASAFYVLQRWRGGSMRLERGVHYIYFFLFSLLGVVGNQLLYFKGLSLTTATNTSLLAVMIAVFTILISVFTGNDKLTVLKIIGTILAAGGVIYLVDPARASFSAATTQGDLMIILNCIFYATYVAVSKKLVTHYGALKSIAWVFIFGGVIVVPLGLFAFFNGDDGEAIGWNSWLALAAVVVFPTILAYYWNTWALARVEPSMVAVYTYLQPIIGTLAAIFILGEAWKPRIFPAMALIFTGVFLVTRRRKREVISKI